MRLREPIKNSPPGKREEVISHRQDSRPNVESSVSKSDEPVPGSHLVEPIVARRDRRRVPELVHEEPAYPQVPVYSLEAAHGIGLLGQIAERTEHADGGVERPCEIEGAHVAADETDPHASSPSLAPSNRELGRRTIEPCHLITAFRERQVMIARAAAEIEDVSGRCPQLATENGLEEVDVALIVHEAMINEIIVRCETAVRFAGGDHGADEPSSTNESTAFEPRSPRGRPQTDRGNGGRGLPSRENPGPGGPSCRPLSGPRTRRPIAPSL